MIDECVKCGKTFEGAGVLCPECALDRKISNNKDEITSSIEPKENDEVYEVQNKSTENRCVECGGKIEQDNYTDTCDRCLSKELIEERTREEREVTTDNYCPQCGVLVENDAKFCKNCGAKVNVLSLKKEFMKNKNIQIVVITLSVIIGFKFVYGWIESNQESPYVASVSTSPTEPEGITLNEYYKIQEGMDYGSVMVITGCEGDLDSSVSTDTHKVYTFDDEDGYGTATITINNGEVTDKTQYSLD